MLDNPDALDAPRWVRTSDALPPYCEEVLIYEPRYGVSVGWLLEGIGWHRENTHRENLNVTHWQPLPAPPDGAAS